MTTFVGKVAVITGAGSGIGRALALELARLGAKLALSDVDSAGLAETERRARSLGAEVKADHLNVAEREAVMDYPATVLAHFGKVNLVFNNAGIAFTGDVEVTEFKDFERVMDVDFWGVVNVTKAFLPHLIAAGDAHVINISSLFGLLSVPGQSAYNAAKFAVRGFTEALRQEMLVNGHRVKVSCVHPGGVKTAIARNSTAAAGLDATALAQTFDKALARVSPEAAAKRIIRGVRNGSPRILVGLDAQLLDLLVRVTGSGYQRLVATTAGRFMSNSGRSAR